MQFNPSSGLTTTRGDSEKPSVLYPSCDRFSNDRRRMQAYWEDLINLSGLRIDYWVHGYSFETHDFLFGEDPTAKFSPPRRLRAAGEYTTATNLLTKFGIMGSHDVELYISRVDWENIWGKKVVPKMKDLFRVVDSSCDRPEGQPPLIFEVLDKYDRANDVDFLGGHYVWKITAKRFLYSYEPNAPDETGGKTDSPTDTDFIGKFFPEPKIEPKPYPETADKEASKDFKRPDAKDNPYGNYL
jgi:hypothetical protein